MARRVQTSSFLCGFAFLYLFGVCYFIHLTTHDHSSEGNAAQISENGDDLVQNNHEFADNNPNKFNELGFNPDSFESVMAFRQRRFEKAQKRPPSNGPGEMGKRVILSAEEQKEADQRFARETFNVVASDKIALDRAVRDSRHPECKSKEYPANLPNASVVIVFNNEAFSPLVRTAHSIINRTPPQYLHEIIFLDDFSDRRELGDSLTSYISQTWPDGIVKLIRTNERSGLIRAKLAGSLAATGDVLVFLDAHCEVNQMWLEPILARIKEKRSAILCPMIDAINDKTLEYSGQGGVQIGGFTWSGHFTWRTIPDRVRAERSSETDPVKSPTMAGGLLAADRSYFFEIGGYDPGMDVWGGENLEMSFRTWMCGGSLEFIPCSRVGHIFRGSHPYTFPGGKDTHGLNSKRMVDVWMDEYKRMFYMHRKDLLDKDAGDITDRVELRKKLNCNSFKWYLDNVYPEKYLIDENVQAWGFVRNPSSSLCLDIMGKDEKRALVVGLFYCQLRDNQGISANQIFSLSNKNELRREETCCDATHTSPKVQMLPCHNGRGNQEWKYKKDAGTIIHQATLRCLDRVTSASGGEVQVLPCTGAESQHWVFEHLLSS